MLTVQKADVAQLDDIAPLFDQYRIFYKQTSNIAAAKDFVNQRLQNKESIIFIAYWHKKPVGFVQLYPSFSSVSLQPLYILNDLYVAIEYRKKGIGEALLGQAKVLCVKNGRKGLALETAMDNPAQHLYEKLGWKKDTDCFHYFWSSN